LVDDFPADLAINHDHYLHGRRRTARGLGAQARRLLASESKGLGAQRSAYTEAVSCQIVE